VAATDVGRRRAHNEDAFMVDESLGLYVVADGMGGHAAGDVASQEAVDAVFNMVFRDRAKLTRIAGGDLDPDALRQAKRLLESAVQSATYMVFGLAQHTPDQRGMGTTVSALAVAGRTAITAQVGDSRVYLIREGKANQVTEDHTLVAWQIKHGILTEEEAATSPHRNVITRAVGSKDYVQVDVNVLEVLPGDSFLVCTDGLHGYLRDEEIPSIVALGPETAAKRFVAMANERGGKDNITALVVRVES
jgi:serine/threonine protein phosphatase PrpC